MRLEETVFLLELIFAIFWKSRSNGTDNIVLAAIKIQIKQHGNVRQINQCHTITLQWIKNNWGPTRCIIHRVIYGIFSFKPVLLYIISTVQQIFAEKRIAVFYFVGTYFCGSWKKTQKSQKLEPTKI